MNNKQQKALLLIFEKPTSSDVRYDDLKSLLASVGARAEYGAYSVHFHKPHPQEVLPRYSVELVRDFLMKIGVTP
jgi:hypothetical protein